MIIRGSVWAPDSGPRELRRGESEAFYKARTFVFLTNPIWLPLVAPQCSVGSEKGLETCLADGREDSLQRPYPHPMVGWAVGWGMVASNNKGMDKKTMEYVPMQHGECCPVLSKIQAIILIGTMQKGGIINGCLSREMIVYAFLFALFYTFQTAPLSVWQLWQDPLFIYLFIFLLQ